MRVLVVDAANVVGSVPDGWWRDRAGAAARLHTRLVDGLQRGELTYDQVILVLEGKAKQAVALGESQGVSTVHAPKEGDDEIVAQAVASANAGHDVSVATADRGLIARLPATVTTASPRQIRAGREA